MRPFMFSQALSSGAISVSPRVPAFDADRAPVRAMMNRLRIDKSGMALVETALVAPFLAMIIMGTTDAARYGAAKMKVQQAVNRGLEMSWMGGPNVTTSDIQAQAAAQADVPASAVTVTQTFECGGTATNWSTTSCASGEAARYTQIQISTTFTPSFAGSALAKMLGNSNGVVPISATGVLRIQ
ncbi:pilus assembly protein [Sphingomonadales bacterium 56]|uniref:TadE/TadG family type IV pilus assembly protein n=1 Tax=unclassified Sphingobium TaxID=2611147 RepID=UPI00191A15DA|nr:MULTISPECIES: TadE family protein [unclassified Sphingobium]MBY2929127.1 pilus assembly protein [Sphingomonadales bacterium 56]MBY2959021.1 pilus assembly protein [Sphingomonadales bacterium 58]